MRIVTLRRSSVGSHRGRVDDLGERVYLRRETAGPREQLLAIDRWNRSRRACVGDDGPVSPSREDRLDQARRLDVLRRQHDAVVAQTAEHLSDSDHLLRTTAARRAVLVVEDSLSMLTGTEVLRAVRNDAPATLCAAQASCDDRVPELEQAGARLVFTRRTGPLDVALGLGQLVGV